jgi:MinD-like ATPase involved in chromosome partitioning or flagellar assembly
VTTNNDTPQIFGPGAPADDVEGESEAGPYPPPSPNPFSSAYPVSHDDQAFPAASGWGGWDERGESEAAGYGYPQPSSFPRQNESGHALDGGFTRQLGYPQDPGYGPDSGYVYMSGPRYASGADYPAEASYEAASGYPADAGQVADLRYPPDPGFAPDASPVPMMDPLSGLDVRQAGLMPFDPPPVAEPQYVRETSHSLTTESLLHGKRAAPGPGWRRSVYRATGGLLRFGESAAEMHRRDLINRVRTPVAGGHHRIAVLSLKGGVGKTTTTAGLGATLATLRGDRVIALDANPDRGTLSDKVRLETAATIRDLLNERDQVLRYADVRAFTSQAPSRLEVLASDRDPGVSVAFGADDYCDAARVLEHFYSICITDCGTGLLHSAMAGVLWLADQVILVSSPSVDGARSASATLDWLEAHRLGDLVRNAVVVLSAIRPRSKSTVDLDRLEQHFAARCRAVARIPYDPHLEEGAEVELELLSSETADAYLALAAIVGDGLAWPRRLTSR